MPDDNSARRKTDAGVPQTCEKCGWIMGRDRQETEKLGRKEKQGKVVGKPRGRPRGKGGGGWYWKYQQIWDTCWFPAIIHAALRLIGPSGPTGLTQQEFAKVGKEALRQVEQDLCADIQTPPNWAWKGVWRAALTKGFTKCLIDNY